jgi:hypothetical protein
MEYNAYKQTQRFLATSDNSFVITNTSLETLKVAKTPKFLGGHRSDGTEFRRKTYH